MMEITFTENAKIKLDQLIEDRTEEHLSLKHDTEGCGCVVSGVATLELKELKEDSEISIETNYVPLLIEQKFTVFFDKRMTIDFVKSLNCFQLKSPNQMLNPRMTFQVANEG
jgi:iron-sulfur cluster insertion protein